MTRVRDEHEARTRKVDASLLEQLPCGGACFGGRDAGHEREASALEGPEIRIVPALLVPGRKAARRKARERIAAPRLRRKGRRKRAVLRFEVRLQGRRAHTRTASA